MFQPCHHTYCTFVGWHKNLLGYLDGLAPTHRAEGQHSWELGGHIHTLEHPDQMSLGYHGVVLRPNHYFLSLGFKCRNCHRIIKAGKVQSQLITTVPTNVPQCLSVMRELSWSMQNIFTHNMGLFFVYVRESRNIFEAAWAHVMQKKVKLVQAASVLSVWIRLCGDLLCQMWPFSIEKD